MNVISKIKLATAAVLILGASTLVAAEVEKPVLSAKRSVPLKWCSLGTSITWYNNNVGASGGRFTKGYQTRVMEQIKFSGFVNMGVNGGCVNSAINSVVPADFYTIEHGINDWGHSTQPGTLDDYTGDTGNGTFAANYRKVIDNIRKANPKAKVILCTPRKGYGFGDYLPASADEPKNGIYLKEYAEVVRAIAKHEGFEVADFFATCGENDELKGLSIEVALHPNDAGYQRMANELVKAILRVFPNAPEVKVGAAAFTDDGKPKSVVYDDCLATTPSIVFTGAKIENVTIEAAKLGGGWIPGGPFEASVCFLRRDPTERKITCQIQVRPPDNCTRCVFLELAQDEADITARLVRGCYDWNWPVGTDFGQGGYSGDVGIAPSLTAGGYVVSSITLGINKKDAPSAVGTPTAEEKSIQSGSMEYKGNLQTFPKLILKDAKLADIEPESAKVGGGWIPGGPFDATIHCLKRSNDGSKATCQIQVRPVDEKPQECTRCICIGLEQRGKDVYARILWARYDWTKPVGTDFESEKVSGSAPVAGSPTALGYGVSELKFK